MKTLYFRDHEAKHWQTLRQGETMQIRRAVGGYVLEHLEIDVDGSIIGIYDQEQGLVRPALDYAPLRPGQEFVGRETWAQIAFQNVRQGGYDEFFIYKAKDYEEIPDDVIWHSPVCMPPAAVRIHGVCKAVTVEQADGVWCWCYEVVRVT